MDHAGRFAATVIALLALTIVIANKDLPILRNSLLYARISLNLLETGLDLSQVVLDHRLNLGKPVGFPLLAVPFVAAFGPNVGLKLASGAAGLVLLGGCVLLFRRLNARLGLDPSLINLELVLTFLNPLMLYQFWSAYPDVLLAATFVWTLYFLDRAMHDANAPWWCVPAAGATTYVGVMAKFFGGIVIAIIGALLLFDARRQIRTLTTRPRRAGVLGVTFVAVVALLAMATTRRNPTLYLSDDVGGAFYYLDTIVRAAGMELEVLEDVPGEPVRPTSSPRSWSDLNKRLGKDLPDNGLAVLGFAVFTVNLSIVLLFRRRNISRNALPLLLIMSIWIGALLPYRYTWFNMRFFVPILPILAVLLANGYASFGHRTGRAVVLTSILVNSVMVANFNTRAGQNLFQKLNDAVPSRVERPEKLGFFNIDSLRMHRHLLTEVEFDFINRTVPENSILFITQSYYDGAGHGLYAASGMFRPDIDVRDLKHRSDVPRDSASCQTASPSCYTYRLSGSRSRRPEPDRGSSAPWLRHLGWGLYEIIPVHRRRLPSSAAGARR